MRAIFIYMITSLFRRSSPPATTSDGKSGVPGPVHSPSSNLYPNGTSFDMYLYICENQREPDFSDSQQLFWLKRDLIYGDWVSGPNGDGLYTHEVTVPLSSVIIPNF